MKRPAATLITLLLSATAADAQSGTTTPTARNTLEILNSAKMTIVFDTSCDQGRNCRETQPPNMWFRVTQVPGQARREVLGPLEWTSRSEIIWDESTDRWTLRRVSGA